MTDSATSSPENTLNDSKLEVPGRVRPKLTLRLSSVCVVVRTAGTHHVCRVPGGGGSRLGLPVGAACQLLLSRLTPVKIAATMELVNIQGGAQRPSFSGLTSLLSHCSFPNLNKTTNIYVANIHLNRFFFPFKSFYFTILSSSFYNEGILLPTRLARDESKSLDTNLWGCWQFNGVLWLVEDVTVGLRIPPKTS